MIFQTNQQIAETIDALAQSMSRDPHGGIQRYIVQQLIKHRIIDSMPESLLDPHRACPIDWTAIQVAYFDNGEPETRRKRAKLQRTKMRIGGNLKVWTRAEINFGSDKQVAWQANFYCWDAGQALSITEDLRAERYIDDADVKAMHELVGDPAVADPRLRFSIPLLKTTGTKWMKDHFVVTALGDDGLP